MSVTGEARLWYESLRQINIDWLGLQNIFRQQYCKIGNTREQFFNACRSFHFDKNVETIDAYIHHIGQVTTPLGYQEPQILEVFKKHTSNKIILGSFPNSGLKTSSRNGQKNFDKI